MTNITTRDSKKYHELHFLTVKKAIIYWVFPAAQGKVWNLFVIFSIYLMENEKNGQIALFSVAAQKKGLQQHSNWKGEFGYSFNRQATSISLKTTSYKMSLNG